jgi:tetratricopeptide (TPR) repeat protein
MPQSYWLPAGILAAVIIAASYFTVLNRSVNPVALSNTAAPVSPADRQVQAAERLIQRQPQLARGYNQLGAALIQKARETGDFNFYQRAEEAVRRSLALKADPAQNYDALRLRASLQLSQHRFAEALALGQQLQKQHPRDHFVYGVLTDAHVELGQYPEAVAAADRMAELRPDATSYARIAYLRSLHGYTEAALEALQLAVRSANPQVPEGQAWYRVQLGNELLNAGRPVEAEREFDTALLVFPDYYEALTAKARARVAAQDYPAAIDYYRRALARARQPEAYIGLGDLYAKLGRTEEAERQYLLLDASEHGSAGSGTHSRQYALFLANHGRKLAEALSLMQRERAQRADIYTCDALAWVLFKLDRLTEAQNASREALRLGTRDPQLYYHAGMIAHGLGQRAQAAQYLEQALRLNPAFDVLQADIARQTLSQLRK